MKKPTAPVGPTRSSAEAIPEPSGVAGKAVSEPQSVRTFHCRTVAQGRFSQLNYIRDLPPQEVAEAEPTSLSSEILAPNASEALLAAFGSCLAVGLHANAVVRGIPIRALELELTGDVDTAAAWGVGKLAASTIGFETVHVRVKLDADSPRSVLEDLIRHTVLWSPVANTLHNPVQLDIALA
jgi:uncharacterized OsmC-like protein